MIGRKAKDPVCGMVVDKKNAISKTIAGKTYYFCSEECAKTYEVQQSDTSHHMHHHSGN